MEITEVRIKLMPDNDGCNERLLGFASITFDNMFVIRDLKIIEGAKGFFVSFPSRKLHDRCGCGKKNHLRAKYCNHCGVELDENRAQPDEDGRRPTLYADTAHPINSRCRELIEAAVWEAYLEALERAELGDVGDDTHDDHEDDHHLIEAWAGAKPARVAPSGNGSASTGSPPVVRSHLRRASTSTSGGRRVLVAKAEFGAGLFDSPAPANSQLRNDTGNYVWSPPRRKPRSRIVFDSVHR